MSNKRYLKLQLAGALALAVALTPSAFGDSSHQKRTDQNRRTRAESRSSSSHSRNGSGAVSSRSRAASHSSQSSASSRARTASVQRSPRPSATTQRGRVDSSSSRSRTNVQAAPRRSSSSRPSTTRSPGTRIEVRGSQNQGRSESYHGSRGNGSRSHSGAFSSGHRYERPGYSSHRQFYTGRGRISRITPARGGFQIWLSGGRYPYFIPAARFRLFPLRVGLSIRLGGYYDPLGYVSVYDIGGFPGYDPAYTSGVLHGLVESIDYRRGTAVISDDVSGRFVTVMLDRDSLQADLRPGDVVQFSGDWTRSGIFRVYQLDYIGNGRGYDDYGYDDYRR